ncbi:MAG: DUF1553 domain-containing protein [Planctomycetes bacterium]|nr:DUF1553 domain-containing protein [Planctomycetota bacterium]
MNVVFSRITARIVIAFCAVGMLGNRGTSAESLPEGMLVEKLLVHPAEMELRGRFDYRQLLVTGKLTSGELVDLTRMVEYAPGSTAGSSTSAPVTVTPQGLVSTVHDGEGRLLVRWKDLTASVPVRVMNAAEAASISFVRDIQPVLSKTGCNQGTCHGAKDGKNGFKLSLRGYDPIYDHRALTDDIGARRFNRAAPEQSLMLLKATGSAPHVGGVRMNVGEPYYEMLKQWIAEGVKQDLSVPRVTKISVTPADPIVPLPGMKQQMAVMATYSDGSTRDVTREAFIESGNIEVIEASPQGVLTMLRRGEAPVLVRYEGAYAATTITVMGDRTGFVWQKPDPNNYVDELVYRKLERVKVLPSDLCTDEEFLRRIYLDLIGVPPTVDQVRAFLADGRASRIKRDDVIDQLVGSPGYVEYWTNKWADLLQVNRKFLGEEGALALRNWIKSSVATNRPYDAFARDVLTAVGSNLENPPAAYYKVLRTPQDMMENTTHLFLAVRFNCNKCHDHPFERWTQDQYYQLTAFFAQVGRKEDPSYLGQRIGGSAVEGASPLVEVVYDTGAGDVKHDRTGQLTSPAFPYQPTLAQSADGVRRQNLADWITSKDNQYFARSYVNRLWGYLFGRGIIDPIDDIRAGNPPSNPELLDALAIDFVEHKFDMQAILKAICKSRVYQHSIRSNRWNADDELNYSHAIPRRLPAETLFDALHVATGSVPRIPGAPAGFRAAELPDAGVSNPFLEDFGRPVRESACECERSSGMVLGPVMKLINGPTVADAIADPANELVRLVEREPDDRRLIEDVFLRFLARRPSDSEFAAGLLALQQAGEDHEQLVARLTAYEQSLAERQQEWEKTAGKPTVWKTVEPSELKSDAGAMFHKQPDQSITVTGNLAKDVYTVVVPTDLIGITGVRLEALPDAALPAGGPGRAMNGNFVINELQVSIAAAASPGQTAMLALKNPQADFSQEGWPVANAIDGNEGTGWAVSPSFNVPHFATFETAADAGATGGSIVTIRLSQQFDDGNHALGRFRISLTNSPRPLGRSNLPEAVLAALQVDDQQRSPEQKQVLANHFRSMDSDYQSLLAAVQRSTEAIKNRRLLGVQDLAWALINNPAFLFNR